MRQILIAAAVGLSVTLLGTPIAIRLFRLWGWGQRIREDGPHTHLEKMGTPTMGGTVIIAGIVAGYVATRIVFTTVTAAGLSVLLATVLLGVLGFIDDFIKVRRRRSLGLSKTAKMVGQAVVALIFGIVAVRAAGVPTELIVHPRHRRRARAPVLPVGVRDPRGVLERREPDRRARRPGVGRFDPGALGLRVHRVLAVPSHVRADPERGLLPDRRERRARPRDRRGRRGRARRRGSCGGTPRRRGSSWAIPVRWRSAG